MEVLALIFHWKAQTSPDGFYACCSSGLSCIATPSRWPNHEVHNGENGYTDTSALLHSSCFACHIQLHQRRHRRSYYRYRIEVYGAKCLLLTSSPIDDIHHVLRSHLRHRICSPLLCAPSRVSGLLFPAYPTPVSTTIRTWFIRFIHLPVPSTAFPFRFSQQTFLQSFNGWDVVLWLDHNATLAYRCCSTCQHLA